MFLLPQGSFKQRLAAFAPQDAMVWGDLFPKQYCVTDWGTSVLECCCDYVVAFDTTDWWA